MDITESRTKSSVGLGSWSTLRLARVSETESQALFQYAMRHAVDDTCNRLGRCGGDSLKGGSRSVAVRIRAWSGIRDGGYLPALR